MKAKIGFAFLGILAVFSAYLLYISIESYEETVDQAWSKKAKRNPFLALHQYLELRGNQVKSSSRLKQLDDLPRGGVVFVADTRQLKKRSRIDNLVAWMEDGGTLVVGAQIEGKDNKSILLDRYSVTKQVVECECEQEADFKPNGEVEEPPKLSELLREANEEMKKQAKDKQSKGGGDDTDKDNAEVKEEKIPDAELTKLRFEGIDHPLRVHFSRTSALQHPALLQNNSYEGPKPIYWEGNQAGSQILQFHVGDGLLTVISDSDIWESYFIDKVDHAYLAKILFGQNGNVVLLYGMQLPSLWEMLKKFAPELLFALTLLFLLWLLYKVKRFGPKRELNVTTRRSLDEHIMAMNGYLWRSHKREKIIGQMHKLILQKASNANPGFSALDEKAQIHWLSEHCIVPEKDVEAVLHSIDKDVVSEDHFYQMTKLIQKIGNRL